MTLFESFIALSLIVVIVCIAFVVVNTWFPQKPPKKPHHFETDGDEKPYKVEPHEKADPEMIEQFYKQTGYRDEATRLGKFKVTK